MSKDEKAPDYISDDDNDEKTLNKKVDGRDSNFISTFKEFMLKDELLRAIKDASFERPSEVQYNTIPHALTGKDILCQAKAGSGKTAVFVLSILNQFNKETHPFSALIVCHTRELALQIKKEFKRLGRYLNFLKVNEFVGGIDISNDKKVIREEQPHVVVGTPGRILDLIKGKHLKLDKVKYMVVDECDKVLSSIKMRGDVQEIFLSTPHEKQVMMFSGTMREED